MDSLCSAPDADLLLTPASCACRCAATVARLTHPSGARTSTPANRCATLAASTSPRTTSIALMCVATLQFHKQYNSVCTISNVLPHAHQHASRRAFTGPVEERGRRRRTRQPDAAAAAPAAAAASDDAGAACRAVCSRAPGHGSSQAGGQCCRRTCAAALSAVAGLPGPHSTHTTAWSCRVRCSQGCAWAQRSSEALCGMTPTCLRFPRAIIRGSEPVSFVLPRPGMAAPQLTHTVFELSSAWGLLEDSARCGTPVALCLRAGRQFFNPRIGLHERIGLPHRVSHPLLLLFWHAAPRPGGGMGHLSSERQGITSHRVLVCASALCNSSLAQSSVCSTFTYIFNFPTSKHQAFDACSWLSQSFGTLGACERAACRVIAVRYAGAVGACMRIVRQHWLSLDLITRAACIGVVQQQGRASTTSSFTPAPALVEHSHCPGRMTGRHPMSGRHMPRTESMVVPSLAAAPLTGTPPTSMLQSPLEDCTADKPRMPLQGTRNPLIGRTEVLCKWTGCRSACTPMLELRLLLGFVSVTSGKKIFNCSTAHPARSMTLRIEHGLETQANNHIVWCSTA
jgi:hypothetical protein